MLRRYAPLAILAVVTLTSRALAQADSAARDSARITVAPITVTAARIPVATDKIGTATTVVTRRDLEREPPQHAVDPLARQIGISLDEAAGPGGPTIIRLRGGEEAFSQILMDGVEVNSNGGFFDFQGLMLTNVGRVEVARGAQSALYGSTAVNGVVHFITRPGMVSVPHLWAEAAGGGAADFGGHGRGAVGVSGGSAALRYSAGAGYGYERGIFEAPTDIRTREGSLRLDATPRPDVTITAVGRFTGMDANLPVRDPGATRVPLDSNARNGRDRVMATVHATSGNGRLRHRLGASVYGEAFAYDDQRDSVFGNGFFVFDADFGLRSRFRNTTVDYLGIWDVGGGMPLAMAFGAQAEHEDLRSRTSGDYGSDTLTFGRAGGAAYAEARATVGRRLHALLGARADKVEGLAPELSPRANAVFDLGHTLALRGAVGRAWKAPNLEQQYLDNPFIISNPDLHPETSWSYELGIAVRPATGLELEAGVFRQDYADLIRTVRSTSDTTRQTNQNVGRAMAQGLELGARYNDRAGRVVALGVTWLTTRVLDNTGLNPAEYPLDEPLPYRPAITASALASVPIGPLELAVRGSVVGQQVVLSERFSGSRVTLDAYRLLGATASYPVRAGLVAFVRGDNILNTQYETGYDRRGWPRVWTLGLRWGT